MVGHTEAELTQSFGQPTRRENIEGHAFLIYEQSDVWIVGSNESTWTLT